LPENRKEYSLISLSLVLWSSVVTLIIPFAANLGVTAMVVSRVVLGFLLGASWPAIHPMTAVWIPPMDRSKFISNMMASALGAAITMPICGYLISWFGWPSVFYSTGESFIQQVESGLKTEIFNRCNRRFVVALLVLVRV
jgi:MFS family permease